MVTVDEMRVITRLEEEEGSWKESESSLYIGLLGGVFSNLISQWLHTWQVPKQKKNLSLKFSGCFIVRRFPFSLQNKMWLDVCV